MIIYQDLKKTSTISSHKDWEIKCPPKKKGHWKKEFSAYEFAKIWCKGIPPIEFDQIFKKSILSLLVLVDAYPEK